jgi:deazaflavin-dependent nitroreductase family protein
VASNGGAAVAPAWYHNLVADPIVTIQVGRSIQQLRAEVARPEDHARLWPRLVAMYPPYDDYQAKTEREIPVVLLRSPLTAG